MKFLITISIFIIFSAFCYGQKQRIKIGDETRQFTLYVPKTVEVDKPIPLVLNLHGSGMSSTEQMFYSDMNKTADKYGFAVLYPQGKNEDWNVGFEMDYDTGQDDVGYIKQVLQEVKNEISVDENAIFAIGLSRGGFFTHRLAAEMPGTFAAICAVGAPIPLEVMKRNNSKEKLAVLIVHGTDDEIVLYKGKEGAYASVDETVAYWLGRNDTKNIPTIEKIDTIEDGTSVIQKNYGTNSNVILLTIENGGHTWPGAHPFNIGFPLGKTTQDISMNEIMWKFFDANRK